MGEDHPTEGAWLWSRDCFKILPFVMMQRVARVRQRQLIYSLQVEYACFQSTYSLVGCTE